MDNNSADLEAMNADGIGFKAFANASGVDFERLNDDRIYAGLDKMRELGNLIGLHAENEWVCTYLSKQLKAAGRTDRAAWYESRPPFAELETDLRAIYWAKVTGGNLQIVHISIADGIRALSALGRKACMSLQRPVRITCSSITRILNVSVRRQSAHRRSAHEKMSRRFGNAF